VNKELLKEIILEQREELLKKEFGIPRRELLRLSALLPLPQAVIISGIRRAGKSTLLGQIIRRHYAQDFYYFNFEDERLMDFGPKDFNVLYELFIELYGDQKTFFFDEVQNVSGWEAFIRRMHDRKLKFFITGSNASLLSKELGTKLTGRYINIELLPFSFDEYLDFIRAKSAYSTTKERAAIKKELNTYFEKGGMPEFLKYGNSDILKTTYENILYRDIAARYELKETKSLRELSLYLLSNPGTLFSYNNLRKALGLGSVNTVKSYIEYLENSYLFFIVNAFDYSLKRQSILPKKAYFIDPGLANAVSFQFSGNKGRYLENLVFLNLKRKNEDIYYFKTSAGLEVDFLIKKGKKVVQLIQAAWSTGDDSVKKREFKALEAGLKETKAASALIITYDDEGELSLLGKKIKILPIYKWLLEK